HLRGSILTTVRGRLADLPSAMASALLLYRALRRPVLVLALAAGVAGGALAHGDQHPAAADAKGIATGIAAQERLTGTVAEVVIDDSAGAIVYRYRELRQDDGSAIALQGAAADAVAAGSRVELAGRRNGKTFDV